ncbi:MAG: hypothetical protein K2L47_00290, partial [Clostridia bacterium]|nr:hypothetical protein [Clostridia bacterium]
MKNKFKLIVSLAILLTLALLAFTGCTTTETDYNLDNIGSVIISDAMEEVLSSCVVIEVAPGNMTYYYSMGVAITEDKIIVPRQTIPINRLNFVETNCYKGRVYNTTGRFDFVYKSQDNTFGQNNDYGFNVLTLKDTNSVKLKPVKFAENKENSDIIALGEMIFGMEINLPDRNVWGSLSYTDIPTSEYLKAIPVLVSSKSMMTGVDIMSNNPNGIPTEMIASSFTTQGYFNKSDYDTYVTGFDSNHGFSSINKNDNYVLTN